jgi:hypothetical protein
MVRSSRGWNTARYDSQRHQRRRDPSQREAVREHRFQLEPLVEPGHQQHQRDHKGERHGQRDIIGQKLGQQWQEIAEIGTSGGHLVDQSQGAFEHQRDHHRQQDQREGPGGATQQIQVDRADPPAWPCAR